MDLVFEDPSPGRYGAITQELREVLTQLQEHPGRWIKVFEGKSSTADSRKSTLYQQVIPDLIADGGTYEVTTEKSGDGKKVFVRYFHPGSEPTNGDAG